MYNVIRHEVGTKPFLHKHNICLTTNSSVMAENTRANLRSTGNGMFEYSILEEEQENEFDYFECFD